jgi:hypothetical protein
MTRMAEEFFASSPLLMLPILSLLVFLTVFLTVVVRTIRTSEDTISSRASLPLEDQSHE